MKAELRMVLLGVVLGGLVYAHYNQQERLTGLRAKLLPTKEQGRDLREKSDVATEVKASGAEPESAQTANPATEVKKKQDPILEKARTVQHKILKTMAKTHVFRDLAARQIAQEIDKMYADYFKTLSAEKIAALRQLMVDSSTYGMDEFYQIQQDGLSEAERQKRKIEARKYWEEQQRKMEELLGKDELEKMEAYEQSMGERQRLTEFKNMLDSAGLDMNADQTDALLDMMRHAREAKLTAEENEELYNLSTRLPEERKMTGQEYELRWREAYHARYLEGATSILTADQLKVFEQYLNQQLDVAESYAEYKPAQMPELNDKAPVKLGKSDTVLPSPVMMPVSDTARTTWGDNQHGSVIVASNTANGALMISAKTGSGWGCGITFFPESSAKNSDNSIDASGAKQVVVRVNAPAGMKLRLGLLESGATIVGADSYTGVAGADGEAFRHGGITTTEGRRTYTIPLSAMKLLGGYGNQNGNRTMDVQAVKAVEVLIPGGQPDADFEVEWVRLE